MFSNKKIIKAQLEILSGLHAGVTVVFDKATLSLGSEPTCDIVLRDPRLESHHLNIGLQFPYVMVEAYAGGITVDDIHVSEGTGLRSLLPLKLTVNGVSLRITARASASAVSTLDSFSVSLKKYRVGLILIGVVLALSLSLRGLFMEADTIEVAPAGVQRSFEKGTKNVKLPPALNALRAKLAELQLTPLHIEGQGTYLRASGALTSEQRTRWEQALQWFDRTYGTTHVLENAVTIQIEPAAPRVKIQAVWQGVAPYVIGEHGERLYPGAAMSDGWILLRIEKTQLVLKRNATEYVFTL